MSTPKGTAGSARKKATPRTERKKAQTAAIGRPTDYRPEFVEIARQQCGDGATDVELADFFGVSVRTLYRWKHTFPEFCQALRAGKEKSDERVERSLFERACGYERDEVDIRVVSGNIVQTPVRKFYPPDTTAAIFWLKNRRPDLWRDKSDLGIGGTPGAPPVATVSADQVAAFLQLKAEIDAKHRR